MVTIIVKEKKNTPVKLGLVPRCLVLVEALALRMILR